MARASSAAASACWWSSCPPIPPVRCTSGTGATRPTERPSPTSSRRPASAWRASTTSTMPDGRWTSSPSAPGCDISSCSASSCRFPRTAEQRRRPAAQVLAGLPPDAPAGDKEAYIDALIARARALLGADGFQRVLELALGLTLADIRADLAEFGVRFDYC